MAFEENFKATEAAEVAEVHQHRLLKNAVHFCEPFMAWCCDFLLAPTATVEGVWELHQPQELELQPGGHTVFWLLWAGGPCFPQPSFGKVTCTFFFLWRDSPDTNQAGFDFTNFVPKPNMLGQSVCIPAMPSTANNGIGQEMWSGAGQKGL